MSEKQKAALREQIKAVEKLLNRKGPEAVNRQSLQELLNDLKAELAAARGL